MAISLNQLARELDAQLVGDPNHQIDACANLDAAKSNQLSFIYNKKYVPALKETQAGVVIVSPAFASDCVGNALVVSNPYLAYAKAAALIYQVEKKPASIHPTAVLGNDCSVSNDCTIAANVVIGDRVTLQEGCSVGPGCFIDDDVVIGKNSRLVSNVTLSKGTILGEDNIIHASAVIGSDGFGYAPQDNKQGWFKIPQLGRVVMGDDVEIGANTCIDCGALGDTVIGNGVKIDNLVQIAHNVQIGDHTAIAACTGIAGSTKIGAHCTLAGGVGLVGHISIADGVHITGMTMVTHSIKEAGAYSSGTPFQSNGDWLKNAVRFKQLDTLSKKINKLIKSQKES